MWQLDSFKNFSLSIKMLFQKPRLCLGFFFLILIFSFIVRADEQPSPAIFKQWSQDTQWLALLHADSSGVSKIKGGDFFLAKNGAQDPLAELKETYSQMFEMNAEIGKNTQCRFLARRDFFVRHSKLNLKTSLWPCEDKQQWLQKLDVDQVSLIFASGDMNSAASVFGHLFLRFENSQKSKKMNLLNYGVNFAARTGETDGALYTLYGLFGYFPGAYVMLPYHQLILGYSHLEGRDLWEYKLDLTAEETQRLVWHLLELDGSYVDYYFLNVNCATEIQSILQAARIRPGTNVITKHFPYAIPLDVLKELKPMIVETVYRPSLETEWNHIWKKMSSADKQVFLKWWSSLASGESGLSYKISDEVSVEQIEARQKFVQLKKIENANVWSELDYRLSIERAKKGKINSLVLIKQDDLLMPASPLASIGSSRLGLMVGDRNQKTFSALQYYANLRDLLADDVGVQAFQDLRVLDLQLNYEQQRSLRWEHIHLLDMLSTRAISPVQKGLSWGVSLGADAILDDKSELSDNLRSFADFKLGMSFDLFDLAKTKMRWVNLVLASPAQDYHQDLQAVYGFQSMLLLKNVDFGQGQLMFKNQHGGSFQQLDYKFEYVFNNPIRLPDKNWDLRFSWLQQNMFDHRLPSLSRANEKQIVLHAVALNYYF